VAEKTGIAWTDATFNFAWGCTKVSAGCAHCYAEGEAKRFGHDVWGPQAPRRTFGDKHWNDPIRWARRWAEEGHDRRMRIFTSSMADVFEDHPTIEAQLPRLWELIRATPDVDWQILTKRVDRMARLLPSDLPNVWAIASVEDQPSADLRVAQLLEVRATVRGVSYEPAIGPVDFTRLTVGDERELDALHGYRQWTHQHVAIEPERVPRLDWIIVGGESGRRARPFDVAWARSTIAQCRAAGVACFVKQVGARPYDSAPMADVPGSQIPIDLDNITELDEETFMKCIAAAVVTIRDPKGGDMAEWPADLRVREFPR